MAAPCQILLYYLYSPLADPAGYVEEHTALCERLGLRGRILVASEGINGTVSGTREATAEYMDILHADERTAAMEFKVDPADGHAFPKLAVRLREEVVTLGLGPDDFSPCEVTGIHLAPGDWREMMDRDDVVLLDARNDYEWALGHFEGALLPDVGNFRELPEWVAKHRAQLEGKKILTYCTGGIRCEKFSGFLRKAGFPEVYQLQGGIVSYGKDDTARGDKFEGRCYVFDERIAVDVNRSGGQSVVARCQHCGEPCDRYVNCAWAACNTRHFCCPACEASTRRYCGAACAEAAVVSLAAEGNDGF